MAPATTTTATRTPNTTQLCKQLKAETDAAKRKDLIIKMNDILVSQVVVIPLVARTQPTDGKSKQLQGIKPNPWDSVLWNVAEWTKTQ